MNYGLLKDIIDLVEQYELEKKKKNSKLMKLQSTVLEDGLLVIWKKTSKPDWEGKENGRSPRKCH